MSLLDLILIAVVLTALGVAAYAWLFGGDRRQARIEDRRTESLERQVAPGAGDLDPTRLDR